MELKKIDPDDLSDVLGKVEKSFEFKFGNTELKDITTFGELCDIITNNVQGVHSNDCTTQQAFYRIRNAIASCQMVNKDIIRPDTELKLLFPRLSRRKQWKQFQNELNIPINILSIKAWLGCTIFTGIIISLVLFFFIWKYALSGLAFFVLAGWIANKYFAK